MWYYYRSCRRYSRPVYRILYLFILSLLIGIIWTVLTRIFFDTIDDLDRNEFESENTPLIFCFVLSANDRHLTSARTILYSWGKRCDRFYFVTRLQNTSVDLMMLEKFENITDVTPMTITQQTLDALLYLQEQQLFSSYQWFLRASDDSFVIIPNLRRLVNQLHRQKKHQPLAYVGDVEEMYRKHQIITTGSVMLFNRDALNRLAMSDDSEHDQHHSNREKEKCLTEMIYDHELVACIKQLGVHINPMHSNLILSQNLSSYKMDERLKGGCCSSDTIAFRSSNETDMYKFDFLYHRLDASSKITS